MVAELDITSNFTFLTGGSHPEELVERAALLGISALAIADENSVAGIVRAHMQIAEIARQVREQAAAEAAGGPIGPPRPWAPPPTPPERYPGLADSASRGPAPPPDDAAPSGAQGQTDAAASGAGPDTSVRAPDAPPPPAAAKGTPASAVAPPPCAPVAAFEAAAPRPALSPSLDIRCVPRLIPGARLVTTCGLAVTALPRDRAAWGRLCRLLTLGRRRADKGACHLGPDDLLEWCEGMELLLHPAAEQEDADHPETVPQAPPSPRGAGAWPTFARRLTRRFPGQVSLLVAPRYDGQDRARLDRLATLAAHLGLPTVASAAPLMHHGTRRRLADVLTAIRLGTRVDGLGRTALANAERRLRSPAEMRRLFAGHEAALARTDEVAARCTFSLDELRYEYPSEVSGAETPADRLRRLALEGLRWRYPSGAPAKVRATLEHELALIARLGYEPYFLTVHDVVAFARSRDILCQGRGSAANSVVCYALGVTSVSPEIGTMVFERFVSEARGEPPDIDVDFEHERREEVIQCIYARYGRHRAGLCATVIHYRGKRAIREVGRAMGLTDDTISALSSQLWGFFSAEGLEDEPSARDRPRPRRPAPAPDPRPRPRDPGLPPPSLAARGRLRHHRGPARRAGPGRERDDGGPDGHLLGQGRHRRPRHPQGRCPRPRHADLHPQGIRPGPPPPRHRLHARHDPARGRGALRHALPRRHASASSRWRAGRR